MTKVYVKQEFASFYDHDDDRFCDLEFIQCKFVGCSISLTKNPRHRSVVRNITLKNCEVQGCALDTAIVEDVRVLGLKTSGLFQAWGAVYKHVVLEGKIGRIMLSPLVSPATATPEEQKAFDEGNAIYYQTVDWALDISKGEFQECEIQRVPAKLVRRDTATQVVVTREKVLDNRWRELDLSGTHWATSIQFMLNRGDQDVVLVAPKRNPKYRQLLEGLMKLREAGIAEPD